MVTLCTLTIPGGAGGSGGGDGLGGCGGLGGGGGLGGAVGRAGSLALDVASGVVVFTLDGYADAGAKSAYESSLSGGASSRLSVGAPGVGSKASTGDCCGAGVGLGEAVSFVGAGVGLGEAVSSVGAGVGLDEAVSSVGAGVGLGEAVSSVDASSSVGAGVGVGVVGVLVS